MKLEPNEIISGRYKILELLGVGGMANVYCAKDTKLERNVTFKVLKEEFVDEQFIEKFRKEAMTASKLSHINIANVYDVGNDGNIHYIVMEYVDGYTLKDIIKVKSPFSNEEVLGVGIQIATALSVAHSVGIVHRDIKPQNILVTKQGTVKVTDFGIARASTSNTITTDVMGSVHYFSPEQARGSYVDFKSDIYSLGIILYEMSTGEIPFDGSGAVQLAMQHINDPLPDMKELNPEISSSLEKIILKCTQKNMDNRYGSAQSLNDDLKKALSDESGDFVTENNVLQDSPTVIITPEQIEMVKNLSKEREREDIVMAKPNRGKIKPPQRDITYPKDKKENNIEKKVIIWAVLTAFSIIIIISSFLVFWIFADRNSEVPNFVGKSFEKAVEMAKKQEIYITNTEEEFSDIIAEGSVIRQSIDAGKKVEKGVNIDVAISLGTGKFELEDFVGLDISEVYRKIENLAIKIKEEYINDNKIERGKVIRQMPKAGTTIKPEDEITLYVSKGEENIVIVVPNLKNLDEDRAKETIKSFSLEVGKITKAESNTVEKGKVISQSINYGNEVNEGTAISLVISTGKPEITTEPASETTTEAILDTTAEDETKESDNKAETTTKAVLKQADLTIAPVIFDDKESVEVKVVKIFGGERSEIYIGTHTPSDFPLKINVVGSEPTEFQLYIDGKLIGTETKFN